VLEIRNTKFRAGTLDAKRRGTFLSRRYCSNFRRASLRFFSREMRQDAINAGRQNFTLETRDDAGREARDGGKGRRDANYYIVCLASTRDDYRRRGLVDEIVGTPRRAS